MKKFTTNDEIESLCEAMIKDFFKSRHYTNVLCVDIEGLLSRVNSLGSTSLSPILPGR